MPYISVVAVDPPDGAYATVGSSIQPNVRWHADSRPPDDWLLAWFEAWNTSTGETLLSCGSLEGIQFIPEVCEGYYTWSKDSFTMPDASVRIRCRLYGNKGTVFDVKDWVVHPIPKGVTLTIEVRPAEGGTTWPRPGVHTYVRWEKVTVWAFPKEGWYFDRWELDGVVISRDTEVNIVMDTDHRLTAFFSTTQPPPPQPPPTKPVVWVYVLPVVLGLAMIAYPEVWPRLRAML